MTTSSKDYYIITDTYNWADEMDISCVQLYTKDEFDAAKKEIRHIKTKYPEIKETKVYIGTNESIDVSIDDVEAFLKSAKKITEAEYKVIEKYVGSIGINPYDSFIEDASVHMQKVDAKRRDKLMKEAKKREKLKAYKRTTAGKNEEKVKKFIKFLDKEEE